MQIQRTAAILLSQQAMHPCGATAWVKQTGNALEWVKTNSLILHSSAGMQTWELVTALAATKGIPLKLLLPASSEKEYFQLRNRVIEQFALDEAAVTFRALLPDEGEEYDKHKFMQERDRLIARNADVLIPLSIRPDGVMSRLLNEEAAEGKPIIGSWRVEHRSRVEPLGYKINSDDLSDEIKRVGDEYIIHWTRASNNRWPTERAVDYYLALTRSQTYPRGGFETLQNIVGKRRIVASSEHMPEKTPTVCFSALSPVALTPLIRWRARYRQMTFEPYGVGIEHDTAIDLGIREVHYYDRDSGAPADVPAWLTQSKGVTSDWRQEKEYRYRGDFDLSEIPKDRLACFCRTRAEAARLENSTGLRAVAFTP